MNLIELAHSVFPLWWPGAVLWVLWFGYLIIQSWKSSAAKPGRFAQAMAALLAYSLLCVAVTITSRSYLGTSHLIALALAMLAAGSFLIALYVERVKILMRSAGIILLVTAASASYGNWFPQIEGRPIEHGDLKPDVYSMTTQQLTDYGEMIIFGEVGSSKIQGAIGKAQCPLCHAFREGQYRDSAPNLIGVVQRATERLKDPRYHLGAPEKRTTVQHEAFPGSGTATNALEYLVESDVCHSCYVLEGWGVRGSHDTDSGAPSSLHSPINLSVDDVVAVTTWLYVHSKEPPPSPEEIEAAYRKFIPKEKWEAMKRRQEHPTMPAPQGLLASGEETLVEMFDIAQCGACHTIPGIPGANGTMGPKLVMKTLGPRRLNDRAYRGKTSTVREFVTESILDPSIYVTPSYPDNVHPKVYGQKLTALAVTRMVEYLSEIAEDQPPPKLNEFVP